MKSSQSSLGCGGLLSLSHLFGLLIARKNTPQEVIINSERPTFYTTSIAGKIALEEHVGNSLFSGTFTTPFVNFTNEVNFDLPVYQQDVLPRLANIDSRVAAMDAANISVSILMFGAPGIQGVFDTTFATLAATNALQDPVSAAAELERCVKKLGGVGSFVGGYTNNGSANNVTYLDDPINAAFLYKVVELDVPIYLHPREPPPDRQRVYQEYNFLAGSPWGFSSETSAHVLHLMVSGIFDTYPMLKIILGHCGEGFPFSLPRIDQRMRHFTHYWPAKQKMTYWENNFYVTTAGVQDTGTLMETLRATGEDRLMFSVDYPFEDGVEIGSWFDRLELNGNTKRKIGYENARNLLKSGS